MGRMILEKEDFSILVKKKEVRKKGKREEFCKESKDFKEAIFQEDRSLRSCPKLSSQRKFLLFLQVPNQLNLDVVCQVPFLIPTFLSLEPPS